MVNSRENMQYVKETIEFPKAPEPYTELLKRFARASLEHDDTYLVSKGEEGINSLMLCAGAYYSACNGIQVKLPVDATYPVCLRVFLTKALQWQHLFLLSHR